MSNRERPRDPAASARARLAAVAQRRGAELQLVLTEFAIERLLYRLGISSYADRYVLKGATLFKIWTEDQRRATWDLDLLGHGPSAIADVVGVFRDVCAIPADDAIEFAPDTVEGEEIAASDDYPGVRVKIGARLAGARLQVRIDVGFGDAVVPAPTRAELPTLLGHEPPRVLVYPRETVVAEKAEAMVSLGVTNSRMKDFYDVYVLARCFGFDGVVLADAVRATFTRRGTALGADLPLVLAPGFLAAPERATQWRAFLRRGRLEAPPEPEEVAALLRAFLQPLLATAGRGAPLVAMWKPGGPWLSLEEHRP